MAGLRKVFTFLLLAGALGAVDVPARNLQDSGSPNGLIDANCIIKCPGAMTMLLDLQSFFPKDVSWQDLLGGAVMDLVGVLFQAMCKHTSVMTCMATQCVPENATTTVNDMNISFDSLAQFMPCICDACPGIQTLLASMASVAPTLQNLTSVAWLVLEGSYSFSFKEPGFEDLAMEGAIGVGCACFGFGAGSMCRLLLPHILASRFC